MTSKEFTAKMHAYCTNMTNNTDIYGNPISFGNIHLRVGIKQTSCFLTSINLVFVYCHIKKE